MCSLFYDCIHVDMYDQMCAHKCVPKSHFTELYNGFIQIDFEEFLDMMHLKMLVSACVSQFLCACVSVRSAGNPQVVLWIVFFWGGGGGLP